MNTEINFKQHKKIEYIKFFITKKFPIINEENIMEVIYSICNLLENELKNENYMVGSSKKDIVLDIVNNIIAPMISDGNLRNTIIRIVPYVIDNIVEIAKKGFNMIAEKMNEIINPTYTDNKSEEKPKKTCKFCCFTAKKRIDNPIKNISNANFSNPKDSTL